MHLLRSHAGAAGSSIQPAPKASQARAPSQAQSQNRKNKVKKTIPILVNNIAPFPQVPNSNYVPPPAIVQTVKSRQTETSEAHKPPYAAPNKRGTRQTSPREASLFCASSSQAQLTANRANAQLSTGPRTEAGKRIASLNAVKTGLTGRTVLLPADDAALYEQHIQRFIREFDPEGEQECELVQSLADTRWRLNRIPALEMAISARGRVRFADQFAQYEPQMAAALIDAETLAAYHKELRNLHLQETRLRRQYEGDELALKHLQSANMTAHIQQENAARRSKAKRKPAPEPANGFEFTKQVELLDRKIKGLTPEQLDDAMARLEAHPGNPFKAV